MFYKALLLLPAVAYARINILTEIKKHSHDASFYNVHVWSNGTIEDQISDTEQETWLITKERLQDMLQIYAWTAEKGGLRPRPSGVFVKTPTYGSDLYRLHKLKQVMRIIKSKPWDDRDPDLTDYNLYSSNPLSLEPVKLATEKIYNDKNVTMKYAVGKFNKSVVETVSTNWSTDGKLTVYDKISFKFFCRHRDVPDLSFRELFGENGNISKTTNIVSSEITVELEPGEIAEVDLIASRGTVEMNLKYKAYLSGDVLANYVKKFKGEHHHHYDVNDVLQGCNMRKEVVSDLKINVVFYSDAHLYVSKRTNTYLPY